MFEVIIKTNSRMTLKYEVPAESRDMALFRAASRFARTFPKQVRVDEIKITDKGEVE